MAPFELAITFDKSRTDAEKRQVWGFATVEEPDRQGDIVDYNGSVEAFQRWAGNIREQHDPKKAIGKAVEIIPDPARKGIWLGAYISKSPDGEGTWTKIQEGILNGYSIKGAIHDSATEFGKDASGQQRRFNRIKKYSLDEVSVVDVPACPSAGFTLVKSVDGNPIATDVLGNPWDFLPKAPPMAGTANPFTGLTSADRDDIAARIAAAIRKDAVAPPDDAKDAPPDKDDAKDAPPDDDDAKDPNVDDDDKQDVGRYDGSIAEKALRRIVIAGLQKDGGILPMMVGGSSLDITRGTTILRLLAEWLESEQGESDGDDDDSDESDSTEIDALRQAVRLIITTLQSEFDDYYGKPGDSSDAGEYAAAAGLMETALVKYGARHSEEDLHDVQKIHKLCVRLGAQCDGGESGDDDMAQKSVTGTAPGAGSDMTSYNDAGSSTARMTTGDQTVDHKKITPQFARDIHALSMTMGASCDQSDGPDAIAAPGNKEASSTDIAMKHLKALIRKAEGDDAVDDKDDAVDQKDAAVDDKDDAVDDKDDAVDAKDDDVDQAIKALRRSLTAIKSDDDAPKVPAKQGFAQDLHDLAADMGAHSGKGPTYSDPGYGDVTDKDQAPGDEKDVEKSAIDQLTTRINKQSAAHAEEEIDVNASELKALLDPQFKKSADNIDKLVGAIGTLADSVQKSNAKVVEVANTVDSLASRIAAIEGQPAGHGVAVRQPPATAIEKMATANAGDEDLDGQIAVIDAQLAKSDNPMQIEKLAFTRGYLEVKKQGTFRGWTPR